MKMEEEEEEEGKKFLTHACIHEIRSCVLCTQGYVRYCRGRACALTYLLGMNSLP